MWSALGNKHFDHFQSQLFYLVRFPPGLQKIQGRVDAKRDHLSKSPPTLLRCICLALKMIQPSSFQRGRMQPPKATRFLPCDFPRVRKPAIALLQLMENTWVPSAWVLLRILLTFFSPHIFQATLLPKNERGFHRTAE